MSSHWLVSILWNHCFPMIYVSSGSMRGFWIVSVRAKSEQTKGRKLHSTMSDSKFSEDLDTELSFYWKWDFKYPCCPIWLTRIKVLETLWISERFSKTFIIVTTILINCHSLKTGIAYQIFLCSKSLKAEIAASVAVLSVL